MKDKQSALRPQWLYDVRERMDHSFFKEVVQRSAKIVVLNIVAAILLFITNYFLIRLIGEHDYGSYVIIMLWANLFAVVCLFGMDDFFVAVLPKYFSSEKAFFINGSIFKWAIKIIIAVLASAGFIILTMSHFDWPVKEVASNLDIFLILVVMLVLLQFLTSFLRGLNQIVEEQFIDKLIKPALFSISIIFLYFFISSASLQAVLSIQTLVFFICALISFIIARKFMHFPKAKLFLEKPLQSNLTFLGISLLYLLSTRLDLLFLHKEVSAEQLGYYNIAARISDLVGYPLAAFNLVMPTVLSRTFYNEKHETLKLVRRMVLLSLAVLSVIVVIMFTFGKYILLFFGKNFLVGFWPLMILSISQLVAACTAPYNGLLMVSKNERLSLVGLVVFVVTVFSLCLFLIPIFSSIGAAVSVLGGQIAYFISTFLLCQNSAIKEIKSLGYER